MTMVITRLLVCVISGKKRCLGLGLLSTQKSQPGYFKLGRLISFTASSLLQGSIGRGIRLISKTLIPVGNYVYCNTTCDPLTNMSTGGMATYNFTGKRVLVTGGANGVGKAIVQRFLETGATVIAVDRSSEALEILKSEFPTANLVTLQLDLSDWKCTEEAITKVLPIHHLVNNAGIVTQKPILEVTESLIDAHFAVNFKAAFNISQIFAKGIRDHEINGGTIVNISSLVDRLAPPAYSAYSCSKAALSMLSKSLAAELGQFNIRSNTIRPDLMRTNMFKRFADRDPEMAEAVMKSNLERSSIKKELEPSELCQLVLFLSSQDSSMITGVDIAVDGGFTLF